VRRRVVGGVDLLVAVVVDEDGDGGYGWVDS
jgi:hypothetical protein